MTVRTEDGRGPADCRAAIVFPIIVTPWTNGFPRPIPASFAASISVNE